MPWTQSASSVLGNIRRLSRVRTGVLGEENTRPIRTQAAPYLLLVTIALAVVNAFLVVGWRVIDPTNADWIKGDPLQSYIGWSFFRDEPQWNLPPLWAYRLGYPLGLGQVPGYRESVRNPRRGRPGGHGRQKRPRCPSVSRNLRLLHFWWQ